MNSIPRILVVTPTLGRSEYLERTVASVREQEIPLRHVLVAPAPALEGLARRFPGCETVPDAGRESGLYGALNAALAAAGDDWDWFTYINDDDALLPGFGETARWHSMRPGAEPVVYGDVACIDGAGREIALTTVEGDPTEIPALLQEQISPLMQQGMLFRRDAVRRLGGFDLHYRLCADLDFWLRAFVAGLGFHYCRRRVGQFRLREDQLSGDTAMTEREQAEIVHRHLPQPVPLWQRRIARWRYRLINAPRYLARIRRRGWRSSYDLLGGAKGP